MQIGGGDLFFARNPGLQAVELPLVYRGIGRKQRTERAIHALSLVGLIGRESHTPAELSGGQQQRVAIARSLTSDPAVILADEPTGNLDSARSEEIMELLVTLNKEQGITVLLVTHGPEMAQYAKRCNSQRSSLVEAKNWPDIAMFG